jgi:hypothetical protein
MKTSIIYSKQFTLLITLLLIVLSFKSYSQQYLPLTGGNLTGNVGIIGNFQLQVPYLGFNNGAVAQPSNSNNVAIFPNSNTETLDIVGWGGGWRFVPGNGATYPSPVATIDGNGNAYFAKSIALGTTTLPPGYTFAVNGSAIATSFTVMTYASWPDYVFKPSYHLTPLSELKTYVDLNHHLPEIPSEKEIATNGLNLGDINRLLIKKVEELTLYLIDKDKQLNNEKEINNKQQQEIDQLKQQMQQLITEVKKSENSN